MADINTEVVGGTVKSQQEQRKKHRLDFKEFKFKTSLEDAFYARAHFEEFFRRTGTQLMFVLAIALIAQALISKSFTNPEVGVTYKVGLVVVALITFVAMPLTAKNRWPYMKANNDFWVPEQRFVLNLKGLDVTTKHGDKRLQWREVRKIFETKEAVVFVLYKFHMVVMPMKDFSEEEKQQIRDLILYCTRNMRLNVKLQKPRRKSA